ncbi:DUF3289 family protein [Winslowiella iniecta]|uniref:DUF3289 family protein n=1 Tax=Winslowiella iniecta TaxID=1560201 RepID=UPI0012E2C3BF
MTLGQPILRLSLLKSQARATKQKVHYRIQDHFGLDEDDITDLFYRQFRIFRIWFTLQRWQGYGYQPFITEMNATITIEGHRDEKA